MPGPAKQRSAAKAVTVTYGPLSGVFSLFTVRKSPDSLTKSCCPVCAENAVATPVSQRYVCSVHPAMTFSEPETAKALPTEDGLILVGSKSDMAAVKGSQEGAVLNLTCHFADEVEALTVPVGPGYSGVYALGAAAANPLHSILMKAIDEAGKVVAADGRERVLLGELTLRGSTKLYKVTSWNEMLLITEITRPQDVVRPELRLADEADERYVALVLELMASDTQTFTLESYPDKARENLLSFIAANSSGAQPMVAPTPAPVQQIDLAKALEESIKKAKGAKAKANTRRRSAVRVAS